MDLKKLHPSLMLLRCFVALRFLRFHVTQASALVAKRTPDRQTFSNFRPISEIFRFSCRFCSYWTFEGSWMVQAGSHRTHDGRQRMQLKKRRKQQPNTTQHDNHLN